MSNTSRTFMAREGAVSSQHATAYKSGKPGKNTQPTLIEMHSTSQEHFDYLQAPASIDADAVFLDNGSGVFGAASGQTNEDRQLNELAVLLGIFAIKSSDYSKEPASINMPAANRADLPPPVRFSRANRKPIPSKRQNSENL